LALYDITINTNTTQVLMILILISWNAVSGAGAGARSVLHSAPVSSFSSKAPHRLGVPYYRIPHILLYYYPQQVLQVALPSGKYETGGQKISTGT
jgi:hypothetical protein